MNTITDGQISKVMREVYDLSDGSPTIVKIARWHLEKLSKDTEAHRLYCIHIEKERDTALADFTVVSETISGLKAKLDYQDSERYRLANRLEGADAIIDAFNARIARLEAALIIADEVLDDIDTASDMYKPPSSPYSDYVMAKCVSVGRPWRKALSESKEDAK